MRFTRRQTTGRGRLSLRSRLLAGLIAIIALFLIVMGVVTTVVLGTSERDQFDSELVLAAGTKLSEIAGLQPGYAIAYYDLVTRSATWSWMKSTGSCAAPGPRWSCRRRSSGCSPT